MRTRMTEWLFQQPTTTTTEVNPLRHQFFAPLQPPIHHLILHKLVGYLSHLGQRVRVSLRFSLPSRSGEPARHMSHCPYRVYRTSRLNGGRVREKGSYS